MGNYPAHPTERLRSFYRSMVTIRRFEELVAAKVEEGAIRTPCHFCIGQEAVPTGVCAALEKQDYVWGAHRSHGHYLAKGGSIPALFAEILCRAAGCSAGRGGSMHICDPAVGVMGTVPIVAATIPIAAGAALAARLRGEARVSVSFFGDGAMEEGHFHESLNLAALLQLPVVFVCENNFYASHMSLAQRRRHDNIPASGTAHGVPAASVDGNDVLAVFEAATEAVQRARRGEGPTLLEFRTFRWRGHVGPAWDLDVGVRRKDELADWLPRDPIARLAARIEESGHDPEICRQIASEVEIELREALDEALASPQPDPHTLGDYVFAAA